MKLTRFKLSSPLLWLFVIFNAGLTASAFASEYAISHAAMKGAKTYYRDDQTKLADLTGLNEDLPPLATLLGLSLDETTVIQDAIKKYFIHTVSNYNVYLTSNPNDRDIMDGKYYWSEATRSRSLQHVEGFTYYQYSARCNFIRIFLFSTELGHIFVRCFTSMGGSGSVQLIPSDSWERAVAQPHE